MFLRFAVHARDEKSQRGQGIFTAIHRLEEEGRLAEYEAAWFSEQERWFNEHLERPEPLKNPLAILWFKSTALEHITQLKRDPLGGEDISITLEQATGIR